MVKTVETEIRAKKVLRAPICEYRRLSRRDVGGPYSELESTLKWKCKALNAMRGSATDVVDQGILGNCDNSRADEISEITLFVNFEFLPIDIETVAIDSKVREVGNPRAALV